MAGPGTSASAHDRQPGSGPGGVPSGIPTHYFTLCRKLWFPWPRGKLSSTAGSGALRNPTQETMPGAEVMAAALRETGIPHARLLLETRSRNTSENARLSLDLARPKPGETSLLVTSAFHMRRAMASFERAGWEEVVPYPVDYRAEGFLEYTAWVFAGHLDTLDLAIKEWVGIWAYAASGR
ncbi:YdcF family protein [Thioclava sp. DLFJ4-1]|uniref:YdcF family protein n=1 Tax=Thioclava sp. DLFJ4-1 TaxID=1915313 RepID=UPI00248AEB00|nr:YdcF family protein [Thioclava sp. DLFJ4-1]